MAEERSPSSATTGTPRRIYQGLAILLCTVLGLLMIINNQMGGEAMWFWYATVFHQGARLYADLHIALQPLYFLMTDAWMTMFGHRLVVTEIPSLFEVGALCLGLLLVLRESDWPDWQKGIVLLGAFCITVSGHSYRFDDYHVVAENLILYSLLLLLILARTTDLRRQLGLVSLLGLLAGLTITTRLTDGAALLTSTALSIPFLVHRRRVANIALLVAVTALTVVLVVKLTGDTMSAYLSSSIFKAADSKGGTGSILAAPFLMLRNTVPLLLKIGKQVLVGLIALIAIGPLVARYWKAGTRYIFGLQMAFALLILIVVPQFKRDKLLNGLVISTVVLTLTALLYVLVPLVLARFAVAGSKRRELDARQILVLLPLAEWASYSAGAAAEPLTNYYAPVALLLLLVPIIQPFRRFAKWANPSFVAVLAVLALSTFTSKAIVPYSWQNYDVGSMFQNREWYRHPVYGEMYIDRDLLHFSTAVCSDIGAQPGVTHPELLSLPYPFPNYFCDTPPWHNYVQTFFDTSTRATIEHLMAELNTAPPQWIVYQRQLNIMNGAERLYNHGRPLAQRDLDKMIADKLASGQWTLVDHSDYLGHQGGGWFIIRTRP